MIDHEANTKRRQQILGCPGAAGNEGLAKYLAFTLTTMSADTAVAVLQTASQVSSQTETPAVDEPAIEQLDAAAIFARRKEQSESARPDMGLV